MDQARERPMSETKSSYMKSDYMQGKVTGIDVLHYGGAGLRCFAFISDAGNEIQVFTDEYQLQSVLELASSLKTKVEASYTEMSGAKQLTRVRILDRN